MSKVMIDAGHGGKDSGAVNSRAKEKTLNLKVAKYLKAYLESKGITVGMTRTKDVYVGLKTRAVMANDGDYDLFVSVHHNGGGGHGYEVIYSIVGGKSFELADAICHEFKQLGQEKHRGAFCREGKNGDYYSVIRNTKMPCVITEYAYMDTSDFEAVDTDAELKVEAEAIGRGICNVLGIKVSEPVQKDEIYRVRKSFKDAKSQIGAYRILENAKALADAKKGYNVYNGKGELVYPIVKPVEPKPQPKPEVKYDVKYLQRELNKQFGAGLVVDGIAGQKTLSACPLVSLNAKGNITKFIQSRLGVKVDGWYGHKTNQALIKFQQANGLYADGIIGRKTWYKLLKM